MKHVPPRLVGAILFGLALTALNEPAFSAGGLLRRFVQRDSYQIGEGTSPRATKPAPDSLTDSADPGPIRLARFSYVQGNVTWRPSEGAAWSPATVNLPIRQGAQVWVTDGGRAEVQFDDGSLLRLGNGAVTTLETLFSDLDGEFTEIQMNEGLSTLELRGSKSIYQVATPLVSIKSEGPAKVRIGVARDVEIAVRSGRAAVEGDRRKTVLDSGSYLDLAEADTPFTIGRLPDPDSWDRWNEERDRRLAKADSGNHLPAEIAIVAGDLEDYGSWHDDARYGAVWCPSVSDAGWRPYQHGRWTWVEPFGWTWVSSEAWGWVPYHYGTWISEPYGWAWVPGPARQPWCPAVVHFSEYDGAVAWAPLCPSEVRYPPARHFGNGGRDWSLSFSIGQAAVYYPDNDFYCTARPFSNVVVNRVTYITSVTNIYNGGHPDIRPTHPTKPFVPFNARNAAGVTTASREAFGGRGEYQPQPRAATSFFVRGRGTEAPQAGGGPVAGPTSVRPTAMAFTPSRTFLSDTQPAPRVLRRPLYRAPLPPPVAPSAPSSPRYSAFGLRPGAIRAEEGSGRPGTPPDRPAGSRPDSPEGIGEFRSRRLPLPSASEPNTPADRARQARRILGQPTPDESTPSSNRRERRTPDAPVTGESPNRPRRPGHVFPGDANPSENKRDVPRGTDRPAREVPPEPRRPEPPEPAARPTREREPAPPTPAPQPPAPEPAPRHEDPRPPAPDPKPAPPDDHPIGRAGGRRRD